MEREESKGVAQPKHEKNKDEDTGVDFGRSQEEFTKDMGRPSVARRVLSKKRKEGRRG